MKLKRDTALKIHYVLDQWVPPILRDCRWFMAPPMWLVFRHRARVHLDFKEQAYRMTEEEFRATYRQVSDMTIDRETDLNDMSVRRLLEEVRGPKVLEVGCGRGYLARRLAERGHDVTVCDIVIQDAIRHMTPPVKYHEANMEALPFQDGEFDTVISTHTLEHVRNLSAAVAELRRVGKRLLIVVPRQRPYKYTFDLHLNFFPYPHSLLTALGKTPADASCEDVGGDLLYIEQRD